MLNRHRRALGLPPVAAQRFRGWSAGALAMEAGRLAVKVEAMRRREEEEGSGLFAGTVEESKRW